MLQEQLETCTVNVWCWSMHFQAQTVLHCYHSLSGPLFIGKAPCHVCLVLRGGTQELGRSELGVATGSSPMQ
jgi:hypothetical protein